MLPFHRYVLPRRQIPSCISVQLRAQVGIKAMDILLGESNKEPKAKGKKPRFNKADHPVLPKQPKPPVGKNEDGSWGPTGLYGSRVKETKLITMLRDSVKPSRLKRVEEVLSNRCQRVQCLFENLHDPANGAACLRTMEGFGLLEAHAVESYEPFKVPGGITMNADKWMIVNKYRHCLDATTALKKRGFTLVATCLDDDAIPISEVNFEEMDRICLMFGNEERGLSFALRDVADVKVYIPMAGFSQSFNISVSCAMFLFHVRQCGAIVPDLDDKLVNELYLRWLLMSTKRAATIVKKHELEHEVADFV
ncbi:tRNA (guanine-N1-)-methyltransferase [Gracilaria domingensis]|nr:tRNA (guanine-N1-)-methyltransferase [Gracilaria domingensis]